MAVRLSRKSRGGYKVTGTAGAYAFVKEEVAIYVGVAAMGLRKRLYFYAKPGVT